MTNQDNQASKIVHKVDSLTIYEVKEEELEILKLGPKNNYRILFDLGVFLMGISVTIFMSFVSGLEFQEDIYSIIFTTGLLVSFIVSIILFILYFCVKRDCVFNETMKVIANRNLEKMNYDDKLLLEIIGEPEDFD